jgi:hypothetical protein
MEARLARWSSSAGIWIGALAWAISTQLNYALVSWVCVTRVPIIAWIAAVLVVLALGGGAWSAIAFRNRAGRLETNSPAAGTPHQMLAVVGMASALLFAIVIALQGAASLFLTGCEP